VLVRTAGRWGSSSGGGDARSWLLIKHRDEWAGEVDITEFAPRSVKSDGDFEDILAADKPDVWQSNRPAKGGEAGAMLATIIERAARLKAGEAPAPASDKAKGTREKGQGKREKGKARAPRAVKTADRKPRAITSTTRKRKS
jgi:hypothetical protein